MFGIYITDLTENSRAMMIIIRFITAGIIIIEIITLNRYGKEEFEYEYESTFPGRLYVVFHIIFILLCLFFFLWSLFILSAEQIISGFPAIGQVFLVMMVAVLPFTLIDMIGGIFEPEHFARKTPLVIVPLILNSLIIMPIGGSLLYFVFILFFGNICYSCVRRERNISSDSFFVISYGFIKEMQSRVGKNCSVCHLGFGDEDVVRVLRGRGNVHENCVTFQFEIRDPSASGAGIDMV
ncbi:MAG: hypothetical protein Hyperionvirus11_26 [Hyperionvirus sp.]|uniref:Uncharacterized protein n=1 Tax=Hyperionvirus sp. TaxID=2487770 RepID=A0A3G5ACZ0_9VIRU|nr:MAG: hypothetical protein Hyperionvirus11_26 [Hyperionvirus sp.]